MSRIAPSQALTSLSAALGITSKNRKRSAGQLGAPNATPELSVNELFSEIAAGLVSNSKSLDSHAKKRAFIIQRLTVLRYQNLPLNAAQFSFLASELESKASEDTELLALIDQVISDIES
ncbi:hypothetical protein [Microbulbifer sp. ALW1]|uniref:hypothetical protein n=1 Tax=Microbulbifer sp. (strain ALW1) TaxID=1516059 RepID=UPI00135BB22F|nr:hypothetical protein [Microbulbifer sp. ALW1]